MQQDRLERLVCLLLIVATVAALGQLPGHDFVNMDDNAYVTENPHVQAGLTKKSILWAFTTFHANNWHPLTWLSHMLDCQLFGLTPGMHHLTNLLFHTANSVLLFSILIIMTRALWRSCFVAAMFALHPLHVESVAWVAERKDVLSTLFWFLTMLGYVRYLQRPGLSRYLLVLLSFALGLMAKPMLVTLPIVLILMDFWPLRRLQPGQSGKESHGKVKESLAFHLVWEKAPLFALTALSSVVTFLAQQKGGAVRSLDAFPLDTRIANALVSYVSYIGKMIWPHDLAIYYPHQGALPLWQAAGAALVLLGLSALFLGGAWRRPYLAVGWLWYLVTLVPVIGLVQVGIQAMADRYTYIPLIGLFILVAWGVPDLMAAWRCRRVVLAISVAVVLSGSTMCTWLQVRHWKNSITLFKHALNVIPDNALAHDALGIALARQGRLDEAIRHYSEALRLKSYAESHINMGNALARQGRLDEAISSYSEALRLKPRWAEAHNDLGNALARQGRLDEAISSYSEALRLKPGYGKGHYNLGIALARQGRLDEAISSYSEALRLKPGWAEAHNNLGNALARQGRLDEAISSYSEALRLKPGYGKAQYNLERALRLMDKSAVSDGQDRRDLMSTSGYRSIR